MNDILIVDDEQDIRETLSDIIALSKHRICETANNGLDAVRKTQSTSFNLVLMDIKMPIMDGVSAYKQMKSDNPRENIVLMTAGDVQSVYGRLPPGTRVMSKPLDILSLLRIIDESDR